MTLSNLKKWAIGMIVAGAAFLALGIYALVTGKMPPAIIYTAYGVVTAGLVAFGVMAATVPQLPEPPSQ